MSETVKPKHCAKCGEPVIYAADPTPRRVRVFHPETGRELYLIVHTLCRREFIAGAESVLLNLS